MEKDELIQTVANWFQGTHWNTMTTAQTHALASDLVDYIGDWYAKKTITPTIVTGLIRISLNLFLSLTSAWALYCNNQIRCFINPEL